MPHYASGYANHSSRSRFDNKFEVQMMPRVLRCDLTPADWGLPDEYVDTAKLLNETIQNQINTTDRKKTEQHFATLVACFSLNDHRENVLRVVARLLRAAFE